MASGRDRRIMKELADLQKDRNESGVFAEPYASENLMSLHGFVPGPPDTPYAGGLYEVDIQIPPTYPFKPPKIKFLTNIWHPNVSSITGAICLDILSTNWSPVQNIKSALMSLRLLLENPNPQDPQDAQVAAEMLHTPDKFAWKANQWASQYAQAPIQPELEQKLQTSANSRSVSDDYKGWNKSVVDRFTAMGFSVRDVVGVFMDLGIDRHGGAAFELDDASTGDVVAALLGEQ